MVWLVLTLLVVSIVAYCMIDGRNVTIRHLKHDLALRNQSLEAAQSALAGQRAEQNLLHSQEIKRLKAAHAETLERRGEQLTCIVDKLSRFQWQQNPRSELYSLALSFDPRVVMYGGAPREELQIIARDMAERVYHEIVSCKFVEKAHDYEHRLRTRRVA